MFDRNIFFAELEKLWDPSSAIHAYIQNLDVHFLSIKKAIGEMKWKTVIFARAVNPSLDLSEVTAEVHLNVPWLFSGDRGTLAPIYMGLRVLAISQLFETSELNVSTKKSYFLLSCGSEE
jgi:hypothetical protein